ncbi:arginine biosynthesis protein ArgJ [Helicobacter jaachi]|uniref:Arginine biosynthesis protein ArgJ n=1 Tax=Helicobacter jaachi TaxID=1677920 RepID=A0A4V6YSA3_9HELI|nr:AtpZ/AtpI family protein [Helicobacter jaachi]TLD96382.1 arginine biosynthesis protein ArgJ [Helicobacter jaachi]
MDKEQKHKGRLTPIVEGANELSVGISIVVAVLLGIGIGIGLEHLSGAKWTFWLGVVWGIGAAILNLYKAYKRQQRQAQELANNPRYTYKPAQSESKKIDDSDDEEDSLSGKYY